MISRGADRALGEVASTPSAGETNCHEDSSAIEISSDGKNMSAASPTPPASNRPDSQILPAELRLLQEVKRISESGLVARPTRTIASAIILSSIVIGFVAFALGVVFGSYSR
jgi:multisubunit Na+/H+ antiporter MnhC subunit